MKPVAAPTPTAAVMAAHESLVIGPGMNSEPFAVRGAKCFR